MEDLQHLTLCLYYKKLLPFCWQFFDQILLEHEHVCVCGPVLGESFYESQASYSEENSYLSNLLFSI
jgi:hypothetical protein